MNKTLPIPLQSSDSPAPINNKTPGKVFLQLVPITLISSSYCLDSHALLDSGSDTTLIDEDIVKNLGLKGEKRGISISGAISQTEKIK